MSARIVTTSGRTGAGISVRSLSRPDGSPVYVGPARSTKRVISSSSRPRAPGISRRCPRLVEIARAPHVYSLDREIPPPPHFSRSFAPNPRESPRDNSRVEQRVVASVARDRNGWGDRAAKLERDTARVLQKFFFFFNAD